MNKWIWYGLGAIALLNIAAGRREADDWRYLSAHCNNNYRSTAGTTHFTLSEFHSKNGVDVPFAYRGNVQAVMIELEKARRWIRTNIKTDAVIILNSGYRSPDHNRNEGGEPNSQHLCGTAADVRVPGLSGWQLNQLFEEMINRGIIRNGGLGRYSNRVHYDIGPVRRWVG
ncbi:MAG: D-Ala-D-Ala carboxypeptidase family metallohydrolase [Bacteroidota bacterium]